MNFIEIYDNALSTDECKSIIDFFENLSDEEKHEGQVFGQAGENTDVVVDKLFKDSTDYWGNFHNWGEIDSLIATRLLEKIPEYKKTHKEVDNISVWELSHEYNIQRYYKNQGYFAPHCENGDKYSNRILAWMIYLNNVTDGGGTKFTNYDIITDAVEGRLVIWPAYWTHTHHGVVSKSQTKYIATGWYVFR